MQLELRCRAFLMPSQHGATDTKEAAQLPAPSSPGSHREENGTFTAVAEGEDREEDGAEKVAAGVADVHLDPSSAAGVSSPRGMAGPVGVCVHNVWGCVLAFVLPLLAALRGVLVCRGMLFVAHERLALDSA